MLNSILITTQTVDRDHPILGFMHDWIAALAQEINTIHVITARKGRVSLPDNVTVHHLTRANQPVSTIPNHLFHHKWFLRLIASRKIDAVFVHMIPKWAVYTAPYCKLARIPLVLWYAHGHVPRMLLTAEKFVDRIVTSTPEGCRLDSPKLHVVGQGIDTTHFRPGTEGRNGRFRILTIGRLSPVKKLEETIETIKRLVQHHGYNNVELHLIGGPARAEDEQYMAKLTQLIDAYELQQHISFIGTRTYDTIVHEYQQGDALLNLSRTNSLDKVALEAMACGIPVVTSNPAFQSLMEAVEPRLFLPIGTPEAAADQLYSLANASKLERQKLGMALRERVSSDHALTQLARRITAVMEQLK